MDLCNFDKFCISKALILSQKQDECFSYDPMRKVHYAEKKFIQVPFE